jgi:hypothetical protein
MQGGNPRKGPDLGMPLLAGARQRWPVAALILLGLQVALLGWHLHGEVLDLSRRLIQGTWGEAVRAENPFYRWLMNLKKVIPEQATYVFLDHYELGKEIEARYHLFPRRHLLLVPESPPSLLFYTLRQYGVTHILVREGQKPPGPGLLALLESGAAEPLPVPGPGLAFRVDLRRIKGAFYD